MHLKYLKKRALKQEGLEMTLTSMAKILDEVNDFLIAFADHVGNLSDMIAHIINGNCGGYIIVCIDSAVESSSYRTESHATQHPSSQSAVFTRKSISAWLMWPQQNLYNIVS